jgi:hypothetical protein
VGDQLVALDGDVAADGGGVAGGDDLMVELAPFDALVGGDGDRLAACGLAARGLAACRLAAGRLRAGGLAGSGDRGLGAGLRHEDNETEGGKRRGAGDKNHCAVGPGAWLSSSTAGPLKTTSWPRLVMA